jgi:hypothetical protein
MAGFDPDAYLAQKPFNPDEYLGAEKKTGVLQNLGNVAAGALRGAGSIGATILAPKDIISDALAGKGLTLESNRQRRAAMDAALANMGADTESMGYGAGKLAGEIAGTAGAPGVLAKGAQALKASPAIVQALRTGGLAADGMTGAKGAALRAGAGAVSGGVSAGMVNPEDAATGAAIGGALPALGKVAGMAGQKIGSVLRGPQASDDVLNAAKQAYEAGYVIPPTQVKPTLGNRLLEGLSGKITTAQNASAKNAGVTNALSAKALGLSDDVKLTPDVLADIRTKASGAYKAIGDELPIRPAQAADSLTNRPAMAEIDPKKMVFDLRKARNEADAWFKSYGRTADPDSLVKAKAAKSAAQELESTLESYAKSMGREDLIPEMVKARQLIAKTYSVENALNSTTGNVDAKKLAQQLSKGKPLSDELKQAAEFAARFPKAAQTVEGMGSLPQTSPLDWAAFGGIGAATANPLMLLGVGARPAARAAVLSNPVQRGLQNAPSQVPPQLIEALRRGALAAPVMATSQ